jgi:hypothetical protein
MLRPGTHLPVIPLQQFFPLAHSTQGGSEYRHPLQCMGLSRPYDTRIDNVFPVLYADTRAHCS